jgi:hypothetical protein
MNLKKSYLQLKNFVNSKFKEAIESRSVYTENDSRIDFWQSQRPEFDQA